MAEDIKIPEVGESITEVFIGEWLKAEGDTVSKDEPIVEIETDKATLEVPSPIDGVLEQILVPDGEAANVGDVVARIAAGAGGGASAAAPQQAATPAASASASAPAATTADADKVMPAAQKMLEENGLDASKVPATGPNGRLLKEDVQRYLETSKGGQKASAPVASGSPVAASGGSREEEVVAMSPLRRKVAERLVSAQQTAALLTTFNEIDMTNVMQLRKTYQEEFKAKYEIKLGFMSFFIKAAIDALKQIPQINAEIRDTNIVYHNYYDIGVAVSMKKGLIVPVIRNAEQLSFAEIEQTIRDFGVRAQNNKIKPDELQGGTFTISNGGVFGSLMSTPIVNPPQSAVLGMHTIQQRPIALNGEVVIRPMMYVALTYDHRIVDGREAVTFLKRIKDAVESPTRMLLEV